MPGTRCSFPSCKNNRTKNKDLSFFRFPRESEIRKRWINLCRQSNNESFNPDVKYVCSEHFSLNDIEVKELANGKMKSFLRKGVMPLEFDKPTEEGSSTDLSSPSRSSESCERNESTGIFVSNQDIITSTPILTLCFVNKPSEESDELKLYKSEVVALRKRNRKLELQIAQRNKKIKEQTELEKKQSASEFKKIRDILEPVLTSNQIDILLKMKNRVVWTDKKLVQAFTVRYFGNKVYEYVRHSLNLPMPCLSTQRRWTASQERNIP